MKHNNIIIMSALALVISLTGCVNTNKLSEYDMTGISFIEYTDIDTVCEDKELITDCLLYTSVLALSGHSSRISLISGVIPLKFVFNKLPAVSYTHLHWVETEPMEWRAQYNFDQVGEKDMYLLHHEEIESLAKNIPGVKRIRFFMTFGQSYLTHMKCLEDVGMLRTDPIMVDGKEVVPLQVLKELLPDPASLGPRTVGKTNIGCIFNGIKDGKKKSIYIYNVCDHQECYKEVESQAVSYTTGVPAMIGSMMVVTGLWKKPGVFNLEEMDPDPYMEALNKFGLPWKVVENPVSVDCYKTADPSVHMD